MSPLYKNSNLRQMALTNLSKMFDMSGKLFWKQLLTRVVENGVFKIYAKSLTNMYEGVNF